MMIRACRSAWTATLLLGGCSSSWSLFEVETVVEVHGGGANAIVFDVPVPEAPAVLKAYALSAPTIHPGLLQRLRFAPESCQLHISGGEPASGGMQASMKKDGPARDHVTPQPRCRQDDASGEIEIYPDFSSAKDTSSREPFSSAVIAKEARSILLAEEVFPKDNETIADLDRQIVVHHQEAARPPAKADAPKSEALIVYTTLSRRVGKYPVDGPGSRMAVAIDRSHQVQGFVRSWRTASHAADVNARYTRAEVRAEIERQLMATRSRTSLHVQKIELVYYDGNAELLQPVYRFVVEQTPSHQRIGRPEHFVGYVRFGATSESVPELSDAGRTKQQLEALSDLKSTPPTAPVLLGAYVARNDSEDWLHDALDFFVEVKRPSAGQRHVVTQLLPAYPYQFTSESAQYANSVDLALVEAHGRPWAFATNGDGLDPVFFNPKTAGEGNVVNLGPELSQGRLRHLVMHSCSVVASPEETVLWAEPWWSVFRGLTSVVGYRSSMYINDGAGAMFGRSLAHGASVLGAWFNTVASLNAYARDPSLRSHCLGEEEPMGRPAAISVCRSENVALEGASTVTATTPADCLSAWWIGDLPNPVN